MWYPFINNVYDIFKEIIVWVQSLFVTVRSTPFLLFTVGFVALGFTIMVFGRLLSHD